jgi:hypothetical protein
MLPEAMRLIRWFLALTAVAGPFAPAVSGQCVHDRVVGREVRFDAPASGVERARGVVLAADCASIRVAGPEAGLTNIAMSDITSLRVKEERRSWALAGAGLGYAIGLASAFLAVEDCSGGSGSGVFRCEDIPYVIGIVTVPMGIVLGAGLGALIGLDGWRTIDLDDAVRRQGDAQPPSGALVRVTCPDHGLIGLVGTVRALDGDALVVNADSVESCPLTADVQLEVSAGWRSGGFAGATIGLIVGAVTGALVGPHVIGGADVENGQKRLAGGATVGFLGAVVGGIVGGTKKSRRWEPIPIRDLRVSLLPRSDGVTIGAQVIF